MNVVILEESPVAALMLRLQVEQYGYVPIVADHLGALGEVLRPPMPWAFIIDRRLSDGDGLPAVRALRAAGFGGPILVTGGHAGAGARAEALAAGADGFVEKPTSGAQLHEALLRAGLRRALPAG
ncbi:MAG: hypothetical protein RL071_1582 [Pseudomonadota bacterium]